MKAWSNWHLQSLALYFLVVPIIWDSSFCGGNMSGARRALLFGVDYFQSLNSAASCSPEPLFSSWSGLLWAQWVGQQEYFIAVVLNLTFPGVLCWLWGKYWSRVCSKRLVLSMMAQWIYLFTQWACKFCLLKKILKTCLFCNCFLSVYLEGNFLFSSPKLQCCVRGEPVFCDFEKCAVCYVGVCNI